MKRTIVIQYRLALGLLRLVHLDVMRTHAVVHLAKGYFESFPCSNPLLVIVSPPLDESHEVIHGITPEQEEQAGSAGG